jgi:hypothetical protein
MKKSEKLGPSEGGRFRLFSTLLIPAPPNPPQLWRLRILDTPWFGIYLHKWYLPDNQPFHNHPFNFVSFILRGGYYEGFYGNPRGTIYRRFGHWHKTSHGTFHKVLVLEETPTWTLIFRGRRLSTWGFKVDDVFYTHDEYNKMMGFGEYKTGVRA